MADEGAAGVAVRGGFFAAVVGEYLQAVGGVPVTKEPAWKTEARNRLLVNQANKGGETVTVPQGAPYPKSVYVAGPMRGIDLFNFPAFYAAEDRLAADGWAVFNPARHDNNGGFDETQNSLDGFNMRAAFQWDIESIFKSDAIYLLKGWERSSGATAELAVAKMLGLEVLYEVEPSVCMEAELLINGARHSIYGHPLDDFSRTAGILTALLGTTVTPEQIPLIMIAVKMSRLSNGYHRDSNVDIAGYAGTLEMVVAEKERRK